MWCPLRQNHRNISSSWRAGTESTWPAAWPLGEPSCWRLVNILFSQGEGGLPGAPGFPGVRGEKGDQVSVAASFLPHGHLAHLHRKQPLWSLSPSGEWSFWLGGECISQCCWKGWGRGEDYLGPWAGTKDHCWEMSLERAEHFQMRRMGWRGGRRHLSGTSGEWGASRLTDRFPSELHFTVVTVLMRQGQVRERNIYMYVFPESCCCYLEEAGIQLGLGSNVC